MSNNSLRNNGAVDGTPCGDVQRRYVVCRPSETATPTLRTTPLYLNNVYLYLCTIREKRDYEMLDTERDIEKNCVSGIKNIITITKIGEHNQKREVVLLTQNGRNGIETNRLKDEHYSVGDLLRCWGKNASDVSLIPIGELSKLTISMGEGTKNENGSNLSKPTIKTSRKRVQKSINSFVRTVIKLNGMSGEKVVLKHLNALIQIVKKKEHNFFQYIKGHRGGRQFLPIAKACGLPWQHEKVT